MEKMKATIKRAVNSLGISSDFSGRNDLLVNEKKFSGHAYCEEDEHFLYHGTLLYNVNLEDMEKVLTPSAIKLSSKGLSPHRSI